MEDEINLFWLKCFPVICMFIF